MADATLRRLGPESVAGDDRDSVNKIGKYSLSCTITVICRCDDIGLIGAVTPGLDSAILNKKTRQLHGLAILRCHGASFRVR